jgi:transketolase
MRNAIMEELVTAAEDNEKIVLLVGDLGFSVVEPFAQRFPNRFFNAGIAEQNMMGMAAGLASEGFHVFVYSIANFVTFRCAEQLRNDVDYHKLPVTVMIVGGGVSYGSLGYSHHAIQDYALLRSLPNMLIGAPADPFEAKGALKWLLAHPQPSYLRLARSGDPIHHQTQPEVSPEHLIEVIKGSSKSTLLCTGTTMGQAKQWIHEGRFPGFSLHTLPLWGMATKEVLRQQITKFDQIITMESHVQDDGFGSWFAEAISTLPTPPKHRSIYLSNKVFGAVGSEESLSIYEGAIND